jgi:hypothetical protein
MAPGVHKGPFGVVRLPARALGLWPRSAGPEGTAEASITAVIAGCCSCGQVLTACGGVAA